MVRSPSKDNALQVQEDVPTHNALACKEITSPDTTITMAIIITALIHGVFTVIAEPVSVLSHILHITYDTP